MNTKRLDPVLFSVILTFVAVGLMLFACFAVYPLSPPMERYVITSGVGYRVKPMGGGEEALHRGVDLAGAVGTPILAAGSGIVAETWPPPGTRRADGKIFAGHPQLGGMIVIDHGGGVLTLYGHLSAVYVKRGDRIRTGQVIGLLGATGKVTGPHLHFELIMDPCLFFPAPLGQPLRDLRGLLR